MEKIIRKKALSLLLTLAMIVSLCAGLGVTAGAYTIDNADNTYITVSGEETVMVKDLPGTVKTIVVDTTAPITIDGTGSGTLAEFTIFCNVAGANLTINNLSISNAGGTVPKPGLPNQGQDLISFQGTGNKLTVSGVNLLEGTSYTSNAVIHVPGGASLELKGDGTLYLYKYTVGAGIGGAANEANGDITFTSGTYLMKGSKTGSIIGNDTAGNAALEAQIGKITVTGGTFCLATMSQGAAIGGSRMSKAGDVAINGGSVFILCDFAGSAIGAGARLNSTAANNGTLTLGEAASLKVVRTGNSLYSNNDPTQYLNDTLVRDAIANAGTAKYQCAIPVSGTNVIITETVVDPDTEEETTVTLYNGANPTIYPFTENTSSTVANWGTPTDGFVYLYLTGENHTVSVNGASYSCTWNGAGFDQPAGA